MRLSGILSLYIARHYLKWLAVVFFGLAVLIFLVDAVELLRRAGSKESMSFGLVLRMAALKLPYMLELILPFAVLFGGMLAFWRLTRSWELVVVRTVGVSAWQFLVPALVIAVLIGAAKATLYSPLASATQARFESLQAEHFNTRRHVFSISRNGFQLRDVHNGNQSMLFADRLDPADRRLHGVVFYRFRGQEEFRDRLDAATAELRPGQLAAARCPAVRTGRGYASAGDPDGRDRPRLAADRGQLRAAGDDVVLAVAEVHTGA